MKFYIMYSQSGVTEYARPGIETEDLFKGCYKSEFQFLDKEKFICSLSEDGGIKFTDFIENGCMPFISHVFKDILDKAGVDNIFYKPVEFRDEELNIHENYWLAVPPRIECLDKNASIIEGMDDFDLEPEQRFMEVKKIVIKKGSTGNYKIFKLPYAYDNQEIIVTEDLKKEIEKAKLTNVYFKGI